jgi:hypothetical protein
MARYILITEVYGQPNTSTQPQKWPPGTAIVDSVANARPGDVVWNLGSMTAAPNSLNVAPLDAAGQALMPGSTIVTLSQLVTGNLVTGGAGLAA